MPKIFTESDMRFVFDAIHKNGWRIKMVADALHTSAEEVNRLYEAAYKRWFKEVQPGTTMVREVVAIKKPEKNIIIHPENAIKEPWVRAKAEYSNHSPYRIAAPGIEK